MIPKRKMSILDIERALLDVSHDWMYILVEGGTVYKFAPTTTTLETGITTEGELVRITDSSSDTTVQLLIDKIVSIYHTNDINFSGSSMVVELNTSPMLVRNFEYPFDTKYFSYNLYDVMAGQNLNVLNVRRVSGYCHIDLSEGNKTLSLKFNCSVNGSDKKTWPEFAPTSDIHLYVGFNFNQDHTPQRGDYKRYNTVTFSDYNVKAVRWEYIFFPEGTPGYIEYFKMNSIITPDNWNTAKVRIQYRLKDMMINQFHSEDFLTLDQTAAIVMTKDLKLGTIYLEPVNFTPVGGFKQVSFHEIDMIDLEDLIVTILYEPNV